MSYSFDTMSMGEFMHVARELRELADVAEKEFLSFLYEVERHPAIWEEAGRSFVEIIESNNLTRPGRYSGYKRTRDSLGEEAISGVGMHAVIAAASLKTKEEQQEVLSRARMFEKTNGTSISEQSARNFAREAKVFDIGRRTTKGYAQVFEENERLKARVVQLETENLALKSELQKVKKTLRSAKKAA